jgi:hypothetical protein
MKTLIILIAFLTLTACGSSGGGSSGDPGAYDRTLIFGQDYETTDLVLYTQGIPYPSSNPLTIDDKTGGGGNGCSGTIQTIQDASTFTLSGFAGACSHLNGVWRYRLTTTCQGYAQTTYVCGSTSTYEIVMSL